MKTEDKNIETNVKKINKNRGSLIDKSQRKEGFVRFRLWRRGNFFFSLNGKKNGGDRDGHKK